MTMKLPGHLGWPLGLTILAVFRSIGAELETDPSVLFRVDLHELIASATNRPNPISVVRAERSPLADQAPALQWTSDRSPAAIRFGDNAPWTKARFLAFDICSASDQVGKVRLDFYAHHETQPRLSASLSLFPHLPARVAFPLKRLDAQQVIMDRTPGFLGGVLTGRCLPLEDLDYAALSLEEAAGRQVVYLGQPVLLAAEPDYPVPTQVLVDCLGQWTRRHWPGKTADPATLRRQLLMAHAQAEPAPFPDTWSRYGGFRERGFKATGFFRTEYDGQRWWLVDPDGYGFFSAGLEGVRSGEPTVICRGMERLFEWLPQPQGSFAPAFRRSSAELAWFDFGRANLIRAFGDDWQTPWAELTCARLRAWRFNTIAYGSELDRLPRASLPYVFSLARFPTTPIRLYRDFPDIFDPQYRESARQFARQLEAVRHDPWMIGYFLGHEPAWGYGQCNLAAEMLEANPGTSTRGELMAWLRKKYQDDATRWTNHWGVSIPSFEALVSDTFHRLDQASSAAARDLWEFSREMARTYVRIPCEEVRKVDPHHLNLGLRYAGLTSDLLCATGEFFDVFSFNSCDKEPPGATITNLTRQTGRPVLIGAIRFGALDRGLSATGPSGVPSQEDRGIAYRHYLETAAANPNLVGVHYHMLNDPALLGSSLGENDQIGFVDCCHTPYIELVNQARRAHENMYAVRTGAQPPYDRSARELNQSR